MDSPVIVIDEKGEYVISLLSGHVGGANEISQKIADMLGGQAVITTATDVQKKKSIDVFAKENFLGIANKDAIKTAEESGSFHSYYAVKPAAHLRRADHGPLLAPGNRAGAQRRHPVSVGGT